jgi:hypothetical protein
VNLVTPGLPAVARSGDHPTTSASPGKSAKPSDGELIGDALEVGDGAVRWGPREHELRPQGTAWLKRVQECREFQVHGGAGQLLSSKGQGTVSKKVAPWRRCQVDPKDSADPPMHILQWRHSPAATLPGQHSPGKRQHNHTQGAGLPGIAARTRALALQHIRRTMFQSATHAFHQLRTPGSLRWPSPTG